MMNSTQPLTVARVTCAVASTFLACQLLFGCVHFGLKWCRRRRTSSWHDGLPWSLCITHSIVFVAACLQHVTRAILVPRYFQHEDDTETDEDDYLWDARLLLLYYESTVLSFFIILALSALYLWMYPQRTQERCDDTVESDSVHSESIP